jgi:hypothetical protein
LNNAIKGLLDGFDGLVGAVVDRGNAERLVHGRSEITRRPNSIFEGRGKAQEYLSMQSVNTCKNMREL